MEQKLRRAGAQACVCVCVCESCLLFFQMLLCALGIADTAVMVLGHLDPISIVALGCVSRTIRASQRAAIRAELRLLVIAAKVAGAMTKSHFMGWFGLTSMEADRFPHQFYTRRAGGYYYLFRSPAFDCVLDTGLNDFDDWETRLLLRRTRKRSRPWYTTPIPRLCYSGERHRSALCVLNSCF
jgi:hypothetical protein